MRHAARRDVVEPALIEAARRIGLKVFYLRELGDALFQFGTPPNVITEIVEFKSEGGRLSDEQCRMRQQGFYAREIRTVDDVMQTRRDMVARLK